MAALNFVDRYSSTLASGYTSGDTSLSVTSASGLPSGACNFFVIVQKEGSNTEEVMQVTNVSGTTLTVVGAQAGTSASNHASGAVVIGSIMVAAAFAMVGGLVLLEQHTASSSASLNFTTCISSAYDDYHIELINVMPATSAADLLFRVSTNGGSSYDSGSNYNYVTLYMGNNSVPQGVQSYSTTSIPLGNSNANSTCGQSGTVKLFDPLNASLYKNLIYDVSYLTSDATNLYRKTGNGMYKSATAVNAFQLLFSSGNVASGSVRCYGYAK